MTPLSSKGSPSSLMDGLACEKRGARSSRKTGEECEIKDAL